MDEPAPIRARRSLLAFFCSALVYGVIAAPWLSLGLDAAFDAADLPLATVMEIGVWLAAFTAPLLVLFVARTRIEERLARRLGRCFPPLAIAAALLALAGVWLGELALAIAPLVPDVQYWFNVICVAGTTFAFAFVIIALTRPSRLETLIAGRVDHGKPYALPFRLIVGMLLISAATLVGVELYRFYLYSAHCLGELDRGWQWCREEFGVLGF